MRLTWKTKLVQQAIRRYQKTIEGNNIPESKNSASFYDNDVKRAIKLKRKGQKLDYIILKMRCEFWTTRSLQKAIAKYDNAASSKES